MEDKDKLKIECMFDSPKYGKVACEMRIVDFGCVAKFSDVRLAKDMFLEERKQGNVNQSFQERLSCIIEKYPNKTKEQIAKDILTKLEAHNVYVQKKYDK